jgi:hypothetical protein
MHQVNRPLERRARHERPVSTDHAMQLDLVQRTAQLALIAALLGHAARQPLRAHLRA